jgi:bleomycin hydrolase
MTSMTIASDPHYLNGVGFLFPAKKTSADRLSSVRSVIDAPPINPRKRKRLCECCVRKGLNEHSFLPQYIAQYGTGGESGDNIKVHLPHLTTQHSVPIGGATNQKSSGRCWIYSGLNMMRIPMLEEYGNKFEYSQNFTAFWDKMERANFFLEKMIEMKDCEPSDHRLLHLLDSCYADGGEWEPFRNVVEKYGLVPSYAMRETGFSGKSGGYMSLLKKLLNEGGAHLHQMARAGAAEEEVTAVKKTLLKKVTGVLKSYLGTPPEKFHWKEKDGTFVELTPAEFRNRNPIDLKGMVHLVNLPYHSKESYIEVNDVGNVVGGDPMKALNVDMDVIKSAIRASIKDGASVICATEVCEMDRTRSYCALDATQGNQILDIAGLPRLDKGDRLRYRVTAVAHGMNIVGCDDPDHQRLATGPELYAGPIWKIENSWGATVESEALLYVSDRWLDNYLYGVVVDPKYLDEATKNIASDPFTPVKKVEAWDPFGRI